MYRRCLIWCFPLLFLVLLSGKNPADITPQRLLASMYDSIQNIRTLRMNIFALERVEKRFLSANSEIKIQTKPRKVYFINRARQLEILYNSETAPGKALVKPNVFPFVAMWLEPAGALMRRNQHYTIHELGFEFIGKSIALTISKDKGGLSNFTYQGSATKNGYHCHMIEYENTHYTYVDYRVGGKETATMIAYKLNVNDHLLRYRNDLLNDFGFLKKGKLLKVPSLYCKRAIVYLDQRLMLPVSISLYDDAGLFESYDFSNIVINKPFLKGEFSREFKDYGF